MCRSCCLGFRRQRDEGLTHDIGVGNYTSAPVQPLVDASGETPVVNRIEWSPFGHSDMPSWCRKRGSAPVNDAVASKFAQSCIFCSALPSPFASSGDLAWLVKPRLLR